MTQTRGTCGRNQYFLSQLEHGLLVCPPTQPLNRSSRRTCFWFARRNATHQCADETFHEIHAAFFPQSPSLFPQRDDGYLSMTFWLGRLSNQSATHFAIQGAAFSFPGVSPNFASAPMEVGWTLAAAPSRLPSTSSHHLR